MQEPLLRSSPVEHLPVVENHPADQRSGGFANAAELWEAMQLELQREVQREQFETWFRRAALLRFDERSLVLAVQNGFTRDWLNTYYRKVLEQVIERLLGAPRLLEFQVDPELTLKRREGAPETGRGNESCAAQPANSSSNQPAAPAAAPGRGLLRNSDVALNPQYRFESFVVGPCNRFAHASAYGVAESPGRAYNPFFLHGSVGLGKTHLLQSLCHTLLERDPGVRILFLSCETFVNHFISALENGDLQKFRTKYRNVDVILVDDIHLLANKERTQEEFFHTFNALYNSGKQIVLSSDSPPKDIPSLQERLVSRFKWGLVTEIEAPCYETRMAILKRKSRERGCELTDEVASMLAEHIDTNIRELEGAVTKLLGYAAVSRQPVSPELVRHCLRELFVQRKSQISMEDVLRVITEHYGIKPSDLQSRRRTQSIAHARQMGMYLARKSLRLSLEEIGGFFGGRDHSTVLYAIQKIEERTTQDQGSLQVLVELENRLRQL